MNEDEIVFTEDEIRWPEAVLSPDQIRRVRERMVMSPEEWRAELCGPSWENWRAQCRAGQELAPLVEDWRAQYRGPFERSPLGSYLADARERMREMSAIREAFREQDELMADTRAQFPYDRYDYGRINPEGPSRWTPPDDPDEKVTRCPA